MQTFQDFVGHLPVTIRPWFVTMNYADYQDHHISILCVLTIMYQITKLRLKNIKKPILYQII